ncbi:MAG: hypothetical protein ACTHKL_16205 [Streptosporangiaceae bacterium]
MNALERRYRRLLRAYPVRYRRERADEMLGTLLESTPPDRRWPTVREARALLAGGLRVRSGLDQRLGMAAHLRLAALLGFGLILLQLTTGDVRQILIWRRIGVPAGISQMVVYMLMTGVVVVAPFFAPRRLAKLLAWVTAALWFWWDGNHGEGLLAAVLLITFATLVRGRQRPPAIWLWVPGVVLASQVLLELEIWRQAPYLRGSIPVDMIVWWLIRGCVVLWIVIDPRPAIAGALFAVFAVAEAWSPFAYQPHLSQQMAAYGIGAAIVAAFAMWQLRRDTSGRGPGKGREDDPELADLGGPATT